MSVRTDEPIAIVGLACRFPGADDSEAFWRLLRDGTDAISDVPVDRWDVDELFDPDLMRPGSMNSRWGGFISGVGDLDAGFFGMSALEAAAMDPQQRLALETSWTALEHSGVVPARLAGTRAGVFMGVAYNDYASRAFANPENYSAYSPSGTELSMVPNRISHFYDLRGPSLAVNTGCSSSLVAVHLACQSLRAGESDHALAGGVSLVLAPEPTIALSQAWMLAADGRCKAFDASADGYVRGEGCGIVVLKRLADARRDGDRILSVIRGSAVNHGGKGSGLTAPNGAAQRAVLQEALAAARARASDVSYVEAHGVGTKLGDATEMAALQAVLAGSGGTCAIGSVKTNIGHLEWASGIASLIKTVLALQRETIPPHLHLTTLNPEILLEGTRFVVPTEPLPWPRGAVARVAGVNSFGLGGTNAHVIVADDLDSSQEEVVISARPLFLALSARSPAALARAASNHAATLTHTNDALALCATTNARRTHFSERAAFWAGDATSLSEGLVAFTTGNAAPNVERSCVAAPPRVAFLFTGQGAQYVGMGRTLAREEPAFRDALRRCAERLDPLLGRSLLGLLYPDSGESSEIHQTRFSQPVLFAIEYALAELWRSWGIVPEAMLGHSVGEYVAACVGGALTLEDAVTLIAERGRLMGSLPHGGSMVAVVEDEGAVRARLSRLGGRVDVAAVNGPRNIVVSGPTDAIDELVASLDDDFVATQRLTVSHAFHSPLMVPILDAFAASVARVPFAPLAIPIASNTTGQILDVGHIYSAPYWCSHLRGAVRFCDGVHALAGAGIDTFLEVGPTDTLTKLGRRCIDGEHVRFVPSLRAQNAEWDTLAPALGALYARGAALDWRAIEGARARRVAYAPTYPFERRRYWFTAAAKDDSARSPVSTSSSETPLVIELRKLAGDARWRRISLLLIDEVALLLDWPEGRRPDGDAGLFALGLTSLAAVELQARVQRMLGGAVAVHATTLFAHPSVNALTRFVLAALFPEEPEPVVSVPAATTAPDEPIAIVGMGLRTPGGATNAGELWELLRNGVDATSEVPLARWDMDGLYAADRNTPGRMYTRRGGFLGDVSQFDAEFFGLSAREAEAIDPQHRLLLEVAFEAIDDAGYRKEQLRDSATGVFVGIISNEYGTDVARPGMPENVDAYHVIGNIGSAVAGRVSYYLGLRGPSMAIDTACSSSLVAVHLACQSLRAGECERALAGGVNLILSPIGSLALCRAQALAGDGRCKTFDASADGYGRGEGCGVVVLRRLSHALADGDRVLGVIRGSAINHDGASAGFTVPSGASQSEVVRAALLRAGVEPDQVDYVEAHGTGTPLGDPIEVAALAEVFAGRSKPLALASVKTNLGHLEAAAGVVGLIKTVLSLTHEALPPHLHLRRLNPHLSAVGVPIEIPLKLTSWARSERRRIAGVSAFGMSGTNAHVVVEEAPAPDVTEGALQPLLPFILTAGSPEGLRACAAAWSEWLPSTPSPLADIAHTAATRRTHHEHRLVALARRRGELAAALGAFGDGRVDDPDVIHGTVVGESPTLPDEANTDGVSHDEATLRAVAAVAVRGAAVRWSQLLPPGKVVSLPPYAWRRRRHWRTSEPAAMLPHGDGAALPPPLAEQVDEEGLMLWELEVAVRLTPGTILLFLGDIGRQRLGGGAILVRDLRLRSILDCQRLRLVARERLGSVDVEVQTRVGDPGCWAKLAAATVRRDPDDDAAVGSGVVDATSRRAFRDATDGAITALCEYAGGGLAIEHARMRELPRACPSWIVRAAKPRGAQICDGDLVYAELLGVRDDAAFRLVKGPTDISRWLYDVTWRPSAVVSGNAPRCILLIGGDDFAAQLGARLEDGGAAVMFGTDPNLDVDCIVDLRAIGSLSHTGGSLVACSLARAGDLLELAQRVAAARGRRLYVVTRGAVVTADADVLAPESVPLWGMGRVIQHEHPELGFTLIDIVAGSTTDSQVLARELLAGARDTQVALRAEQRLTPELRRISLSAPSTRSGEVALLETRRPGFVDDVRFRQTARRAPGPGEIEVRVTHLPLSFVDVMRATAMNDEPAQPHPLGSEWEGEVVRVGAGATRLTVGERAIGLSPHGVGTYVTVCEDLAVTVPREIPPARAATLPLAFALAHHVLVDIARLQPGERLLVHSATGAVGQACIQYARSIGADVLATAGDEPRRKWLRSAGVRDVFDSRTLAFVEGVRHATQGAGVDVVVSSVAGPAVVASRGLLRPFGRFVDIGRRRMRCARTSDDEAVANVASIRVDLIKTMTEKPARIGRLLDAVMSLVKKGALTPLDPELCKADDAPQALRAMAQLTHLGKVVLMLEPSPPAEADDATARVCLRDDASYLVTGGLGGLGLKVAHWLVERGARHLVLVGRRIPDDAAMESITALTRQGATVTVLQVDLGLRSEIERLLSQMRREHPALVGIVHAAGILDDAILAHQSRARLAAVFAAKVSGAWHLHELVHESLDFFVLFSSLASAIGSPAQANYAAANSALDALAEFRRARGMPALSIQWGPWDQVGMAAHADRRRRADAIGLRPMASDGAMSALEHLLASSTTQALVVDARWRQLSAALPGLSTAWDIGRLLEDEPPNVVESAVQRADARTRLETAKPAERAALLVEWLRVALAEVMRLPAESIDPKLPIEHLGLDSLAAVELNHRVRAGYGQALPVTEILRAPSLYSVADALFVELRLAHPTNALLPLPSAPRRLASPWFVVAEPRPHAKLRLVCFPFAGGSPAVFRDWPRGLPTTIEVMAAQLPGRAARIREPALTRMGPLVEALVDALEPSLDRPFAFFGHCMGALVMFEVARRLRERGRPMPCHLFVSASPAPNGYLVPALNPETGRYLHVRPSGDLALVPVHALPSADFFDVLRFLNFGQTRVLLDEPELMRALLPVIQADFEVCDRYRYCSEPPLSIPITAVGGDADPFATHAELLRWAKETGAPFELLMRAGDHYFLFPERDWLLDLIARRV